MGIHEWTRAGSAGSAATGSAAKRPPQEAGPAPGGLAPPAKRRRVENFQPPNSIPIDCTTKQTQDSQDRYGDDDIETTRKAIEYYQKHKAQKKEYYQKNKARIVAQRKEYYQKNKARTVA